MYTPKQFKISNQNLIKEFIRDNGFATLISRGSEYPTGTHLPLELEKNNMNQEVLTGHIAKANPQWHEFEVNPQVLVIFLSPVHSYISSSWYKNPDVPTWNYMSVHILGLIKILPTNQMENVLRRIVGRYEPNVENPFYGHTSPKIIHAQMEHIVGLEIKIEKIEATFKLSQNKKIEDYEKIVNNLKSSKDLNSRLLADVMTNRKNKKTKN